MFSQHFLLISLSALITLYYSYFLSAYLLGPQFAHTHSQITPLTMHTPYSESLGTKTGLIHFTNSPKQSIGPIMGTQSIWGIQLDGWTNTKSSPSCVIRMKLNCTLHRSEC